LTIISGNPFGGPQKDFDDLVRRLMYEQNRELPADFIASHNERTTPTYKAVAAFNKDREISSNSMCAEPGALRSVPQEKSLRIDIVFCHGDDAKSDTGGYANNVSETTDSNFLALICQATFAILPEEGLTDNDRRSKKKIP